MAFIKCNGINWSLENRYALPDLESDDIRLNSPMYRIVCGIYPDLEQATYFPKEQRMSFTHLSDYKQKAAIALKVESLEKASELALMFVSADPLIFEDFKKSLYFDIESYR